MIEDLAEISHTQDFSADRQRMKFSRSSRGVQPRGLPSPTIRRCREAAGRVARRCAAWRCVDEVLQRQPARAEVLKHEVDVPVEAIS
ncbi:hypothetical protein NLM27_42965 [Bradyrhizobium sp. CCGB12]|uniref:hypothetical protein n=1 Tax=Bradyrhizobium sp. CCGB12 TaxID=2949632 RepID=UPI0020B24FEC|nr:hypothetical protein [Bradyrhizobium sp. CCGB12]MCP3395464.1 hypothetical protein [Bradyrhizobium sp. CCGB12]